MKTIKDAYTELKGDLKLIRDAHENDKYIFFCSSSSRYASRNERRGHPPRLEYICTVEEFNNYKGDKMKTVVDAVVYFKAEWPDLYTRKELNDFNLYDIYIDSTSNVMYPDDVDNDRKVCTREQFNQCIEDMSRHAGSELYERYVRTIKTPLTKGTKVDYTSEEFWKGAPEGATHYITDVEDGSSSEFVKEASDKGAWKAFASIFGAGFWSKEVYDDEAFIVTAKPEPKPSPVFTKSMSDANELPSVGMECLVFNGELMNPTYEKCVIDFIGSHVIVYSSESCTERTCNLELVKFKPIDTRSDKEKAIDEACAIINDSQRCLSTNINIDCSAAQKAVIITMIERGYTKPLTVEGES